jgi:outer membrane protein assembly factor BamB
VVLVNAACLNFRPDPTPVPPELAGAPPSEVWSVRAGRGFTGALVVADSVIYAAGYDRRVFAIDAGNGDVLWNARLGGPVLGGVLVGDSLVYAATGRPDGRLFAVRRSDGKLRWRATTGHTMAPLGLVGNLVLAHNQRGQVVATDARTGRSSWRTRVQPGRAAPIAAGDGIVVTSIDSIYRLDPATGRVLLRRALSGSVVGGWTVANGRLVAGTSDSTIVALDPETLERVWSRKVDAPVLVSPLAQGDTLVVVSRSGTIYRLTGLADPRLEKVVALRWAVTAPPVRFGNAIVLGGADGSLRAYELDGRERWRMTIWRPVDVAPVVVSGALIAVGGNGDIYRLEP